MKFHVSILFQSLVVSFVIPALTCLLFASFIFTKCFTGLFKRIRIEQRWIYLNWIYIFLQTVENSTTANIYCNGISYYCDDK